MQALTGTLCVPKDGLLRGLLTAQDKSDDRYFFFLEFSRYYLVLVAVVAISILLAGFMQCCPGGTMHAILFLSLIVEILLAAVFYLFTTQSLPEKIVVTVILGVAFVLTLSQIVLYRKTISINRLFLK